MTKTPTKRAVPKRCDLVEKGGFITCRACWQSAKRDDRSALLAVCPRTTPPDELIY